MLTRLAAVGAAALLLAGCSPKPSSGTDSASGTTVAAPTGDSSSASLPSATPTGSISSPIPFSPPPVSTSATAVPSPSRSIEPGGCPTSALTIRALRGSGAAGHQFAFLQFTNSSSKPCSLTGYPGVQLLAGGRPLGQPAVRSGKPVRTVQIAPGTSVSAGLIDDSSCNAAISDSVQVFPPNRSERIVLKLALRGCALQVDPVAPS